MRLENVLVLGLVFILGFAVFVFGAGLDEGVVENGEEVIQREGIEGECDLGEANVCFSDNVIASIIPRPQKICQICEQYLEVNSDWEIVADIDDEYDNFTAHYLKEKMFENSSGNLDLMVSDISDVQTARRIVIGNPETSEFVNEVALSRGIDVEAELSSGFNQGYVLVIGPDDILVLANSSAGTFYGVITLTWLLDYGDGSFEFPITKVVDWPDMDVRGFYGSGDYYSTKEEWIENLAKYKYNLWVGVLSSLSDLHSSYVVNARLELKDFLLKRHFIPSVSLTPLSMRNVNENLHEGVFAENISMHFGVDDSAVSFEEEFVLENPGFEIDGGSGIPENWIFFRPTNPGDWSHDCSVSHSGQCSVKLTLLTEAPESTSFLGSGGYSLEPNNTYYVSFWAKKNDANPDDGDPQVTLTLRNQSDSYMYEIPVKVSEDSDEWVKYHRTFSTYNNESSFYIYSIARERGPIEYWLDDFEIIKMNNKLINVINSSETRLHVYSEDRFVEYVEGVDYELVEEGSFNFSFPFLGRRTTIRRINSGNILPEAEISVDYDYVINFQQERNEYISLSDPLVYDLFRTLKVNATMTKLEPEIVFIAMDEIRGMNRDSRSKKRGMENYELLGTFLRNITSMIHSYNPDALILIWDDMINPFHNGGKEKYQVYYGGPWGTSWQAMDLMSRNNIVPISWWYSDKDFWHMMRNSPGFYQEYGFDFFGGPWDDLQNIKWWSYITYKNNGLGFIEHGFSDRIEGVIPSANYSWNAIKEYSLECNPEYIEVCDGVDNDCDDLYWKFFNVEESWYSNVDEGFNLSSDAFNCGSCGNICYYPRGFSSCVEGVCQFDGCFEGHYVVDDEICIDPSGHGCNDGFRNQDEAGIDCGGVCVRGVETDCGNGVDDDFDCLIDEAGSCSSPGNPGNLGGGSPGGGDNVGWVFPNNFTYLELDCNESWSCGDWGDCVDDRKSRSCVDGNSCGSVFDKPVILGDCSVEVPGGDGGSVWIGVGIYGLLVLILVLILAKGFLVRKRNDRIEMIKSEGGWDYERGRYAHVGDRGV